MTQTIKQTQDMLARHHRNGEVFAEMMKESFASRFNDTFWALWQQHIEPTLPEQARIVDLGTGPGSFLKAITERHPQVHAIGVECAPYMLEAAVALPDNAEFMTADLHDPHLTLDDASVDVAVASVVVHEMSQPIKSFFEVQRILKPGGLFYILDWVRVPLAQYLASSDVAVFDHATSAAALDDLFVHFIEHNRFSADDLVFMLSQCGFDITFQEMLNNNQMTRLIAKKR